MANVHERMRNMVIRNLALQPKGKGVALKLIKTVNGEFDPTIGAIVQTTKEYNGSGVRVNYSAYTMRNFDIPYSDYQIYLSPIQLTIPPVYAGDPTVYSGSLTWYAGQPAGSANPVIEMPTPSIDDTINFLGHLVKIIEVNPFNENGYGCGWKLRVRTS